MTIGERIAQIRKEKGLSQEAFGESLGVTRQSISKWEANISIPEVDKLLAMCKLYQVSVGWLLGEESEQTSDNQELTEAQWEMLEKITEKYIASMPQTQSKPMFKKWHKIVAVGIVSALVIWLIGLSCFINELNVKYKAEQKALDNYQSEVSKRLANIISGIDGIEKDLHNQSYILRDWDVSYQKDVSTGTITYEVMVEPMIYVMGMKTEVVFWSDGQTYRAEAVEHDGDNMHYFYATVQMPYSDAIQGSVVLYANDEKQTQVIWNSYGTESSTKVQDFSYSPGRLAGSISDIGPSIYLEMTLYDAEFHTVWPNEPIEDTTTAKSVLWKFYKNEQLVETINGALSDEIENEDMYNSKITTAELDSEIIRTLEKGDSFWVAVVVTDNYNREYVVNIETYRVSDDMQLKLEDLSLDYEDPKWFK